MLITNNFHNTKVQLNLRGRNFFSAYQVKKSWRALCGMQNCTCGGNMGERGPQMLDGERVYFIPCQDGTVTIEKL